MPHRQKKTEGIKIMVTPVELAGIDQFAEHGGHWSRAEAVRRLLQKGYAAFLAEAGCDPVSEPPPAIKRYEAA